MRGSGRSGRSRGAPTVTTEASRHPLASLPRLPSGVGVVGLAFLAVVLFWLAVNLVKEPSDFIEVFLIGITTGCVYALVALGYTLVYGILELINFAHGDVFMLGGMFAATFTINWGLERGEAGLWALIILILLLCMALCGLVNATIEFIAYRPLRGGPG